MTVASDGSGYLLNTESPTALAGAKMGVSVTFTSIVLSGIVLPPKVLLLKLNGLKRGAAFAVLSSLVILESRLPISLKTPSLTSSVTTLSFERCRFTLTILRVSIVF